MYDLYTFQICFSSVKRYNVGWFELSILSCVFEIILCFLFAVFDLVHDAEAIHGLC